MAKLFVVIALLCMQCYTVHSKNGTRQVSKAESIAVFRQPIERRDFCTRHKLDTPSNPIDKKTQEINKFTNLKGRELSVKNHCGIYE